ncbi:MAG: phosphate ABC transporter substrate-binding protein PstS family protein [Pseudomonadales bacterium]|nr:phosphate ABC transporter substrate-binding protein PstS family protein [Pseudomonadales bacterium]
MRAKFLSKLIFLAVCAQLSFSSIAAEVDQALPDYERTSGVSGNLSSVGSDTLANLMTLWAEDFKRLYPNVNIQIQAAGSSTAPPALTERTSNIGPMSREMKDNEIESFETRYGHKPTAIPVAIDSLAVYVHKDNPIDGMTIQQVDAVFSSNQRCGYSQSVDTWGQLAMRGPWERRDIQIFGRNSVSGTYGYFKDVALCEGDFKNNVNEQPGSASVVQSVSTSINGISYSGIGYRTSSVRAVPIATNANSNYFEATPENSVAGNYPLARFLWVYVNKEPNSELPPLEREFVKSILSKAGQEIVIKDGYIPLPANVVEITLGTLGMK